VRFEPVELVSGWRSGRNARNGQAAAGRRPYSALAVGVPFKTPSGVRPVEVSPPADFGAFDEDRAERETPGNIEDPVHACELDVHAWRDGSDSGRGASIEPHGSWRLTVPTRSIERSKLRIAPTSVLSAWATR
jgi:hypothetical protein